MSRRTSVLRARRLPALASLVLAGTLGVTVLAPGSYAGPAAPAAAAPAAQAPDDASAPELSAQLDPQDATVVRGDRFAASGTIREVTAEGAPGAGVPAAFTLAVTDATGRVLGTQEITAAADGTFTTMVPGATTARLPRTGAATTLGLRVVDATAGDLAAADAGAGSVVVSAAATGLEIENSFVSSVGWVKPGESYPSRIIVTNPTATPVPGASVTVAAPEGTTFVSAAGPGTHDVTPGTVAWTLDPVPAATGAVPGRATLVIESEADTTTELPTVVWRDLSTTAELSSGGTETVVSHGPKVIPPDERFDTARYGDRPFPVVPVAYNDRDYVAGHDGGDLDRVINDPAFAGSTFNLFQEMSLDQLFPAGDVPSDGLPTADFDYDPGFDFTHAQPGQTCLGGATYADLPFPAEGTPLYPARVTNGVYELPGNTAYYGADANGSAVIGALAGVAALQQIDSGCGPTGKLVYDTAAIADPEIDYSDFDTDKDGVVDFFMTVYAGCGGNGASQLGACSDAPSDTAPYDNVWPHSSSLEFSYTDPETGLGGYISDDQLKDLEGRPLWYTNTRRRDMTTTDTGDALKVFVRVGPYNVNPETAIDKASVISHEYGHSLGLPDFYSLGGRETYGDWNLMATDKSQNMDAFSRQELGWVVPQQLEAGTSPTVSGWTDSKQDTGSIVWQQPDGTPYTLSDGDDGAVHNSLMYGAKLPGRQLVDPAKFATGDTATLSHAWYSGSGNDFGCATDGGGHNLDLQVPGAADLPAGSTIRLDLKSLWDIEWDYDYGYVLTSTDGAETFTSNPSENDYTTPNAGIPGNANMNSCQEAYDNGLTGTSGSYKAGTQAVDRVAGNYPESVFASDTYDISELAGADIPVLRFSYSTDPGLARPGWFIDDVTVTATTPSGEQVLLETDFESSGGPDDPRIFNGGCQADNPGSDCTKGWQYVKAGDEATFDHSYYLEMRDRSGFDLDGKGQVDRDPIGFEAGLYLGYTDEAHGYGNAGTDDPPAQSPLDSQPEPGSDTPDLDDAAWTAADGDKAFSDGGDGHVDNYNDPNGPDGQWLFDYDCLGFTVRSMSGNGDGPPASDGDLTGDVDFTMGAGCSDYDYGYEPDGGGGDNTAPTAAASADPTTVAVGEDVDLSAAGSTDAETPRDLDYSWDYGDGGSTKDGTGRDVSTSYDNPGTKTVTVTVTDPAGLEDTASVDVTVTGAGGADTTAPVARASVSPKRPFTISPITFDGRRSSDDTTARGRLTYVWDFDDGGSRVDARGALVRKKIRQAGRHKVRLSVIDEAGNIGSTTQRILVRRYVACNSSRVERGGGWRVRRSDDAIRGLYCDSSGPRRGRDVLSTEFTGASILLVHGTSRRGGRANVLVDGRKVARLSFRGKTSAIDFGRRRYYKRLGSGRHTLRIVMTRGRGYVEGFVVKK